MMTVRLVDPPSGGERMITRSALAMIGATLGIILLAGCAAAAPETADVSTAPDAAPAAEATPAPSGEGADVLTGPSIGELITLGEIGQMLGREGLFFACYS